jgi:predicted nucleic acid-binding protein
VVYLDTNVLVYASVEQNIEKKNISLALLEKLISKKQLLLSSLTLQEFVFTMAKLKVDNEIIKQDAEYYLSFVNVEQDYFTLKKAIELCCDKNQCKNINDVMHILLAQKAKCKKLITFDNDFKKLDGINAVNLEIL